MTKYYTLVSCFLYCFEWTKLLYYYFFLLGNLNVFCFAGPGGPGGYRYPSPQGYPAGYPQRPPPPGQV